MEFQLETPKTLTVRPAETKELSTVVIERVLDDIVNKKVIVLLKDLPNPIELADLSNENYDNPQWTNESLLASVQAFVNSLQ